MRTNQRLPPLFEPHTNWILQVFEEDAIPKAWIFDNGRWQMHTTHQTSGLIEYFERTLLRQRRIGILQFYATISSFNKDYTVLYLYDGEQFSHTIFHPRSQPEQACSDSEQWWVEPWNIEHVISR